MIGSVLILAAALSAGNAEFEDEARETAATIAVTRLEKNLAENSFDMTSWEEVKAMAEGKGGFARTKWCGSLECELAMKEKAGVSSRCMPLKQSGTKGKCVMCGKECTTDIYWGVAY